MEVPVQAAVNPQAKKGRVNEAQKNILLEFMEANPNLNSGLFSRNFTQEDRTRLWSEITDILNAFGSGARKDAESWKGCWGDLKSAVKKKIARMKISIEKTGGGWADANPLTDFESRLAGLIGESVIFGLRNGHESQQQQQGARENCAEAIIPDEEGCFTIPESSSFPVTLQLQTQSLHSTTNGTTCIAPTIRNCVEITTPRIQATGNPSQGKRKNIKRLSKTTELSESKEMCANFSSAQTKQAAAVAEIASTSKELLEIKKKRLEVEERKAVAEEQKVYLLQQLLEKCVQYFNK